MTEKREVFRAVQDKESPTLDEKLYTEAQRVDLKELPEGSLVSFSGVHPASNYVIEILDPLELGGKRNVNIWYIGSDGFDVLGTPACFIGPKSGCLQTEARMLHSVDTNYEGEEGVLEVGKQYGLPEFKWNRDNKLYADRLNMRIEHYTRIILQMADL